MPPCKLGSLTGGDSSRQEKGGSSQYRTSTQGQPGAVLQDAGSAISAKGAFFQLGWLGDKDASVPVAAKSALPTLCEMPLGVGRGISCVARELLASHPGT